MRLKTMRLWRSVSRRRGGVRDLPTGKAARVRVPATIRHRYGRRDPGESAGKLSRRGAGDDEKITIAAASSVTAGWNCGGADRRDRAGTA